MKRFLLLAATICCFHVVTFAQSGRFEGRLAKTAPSAVLNTKFTTYRVFELDVPELNAYVKNGGEELGVTLVLGEGESWRWSLKAHDMRSANYRLRMDTEQGVIDVPRTENKTYRGQVAGEGGGRVRMVIDTEYLLGLWEHNGETYYIEPLWHLIAGAAANQYLVYRESDAIYPEAPFCGWSEEWQNLMGHDETVRQVTPDNQEKVGQCYKVEVALAADFSMFQFTGSVVNCENFMLGILNLVQTNYDDEFADDIDFDVIDYFVSSCSTCDPWTSSTNASNLLTSFRNWGNGGGFGSNYDVATLWTNRDLAGSTIGVAWLGSVCTEDRYNVVQNFSSSVNLLRVVQAHELGHNFNADHDADGAPFIMAPAVNNTNQWSTASISTINGFISLLAGSGGCFSSCTVAAPPVAQIQAPATHICPGTTIPFIDNSTNAPDSWQWLFPGGVPASSSDQNPNVRYDSPGTYTVTLIVSNPTGTDATTLNTNILVNNQGTRYLMYETFENGPTFWDIGNQDGGITWSWKQVGGAQFGKRAMFMDNYNYTNLNQPDNLTSPVFDFSNQSGMELRIDYAYRRYNAQRSDRFKVLLSINGGQTYPITLFDGTENGSGTLATAPDSQNPFTPAVVNDWCYGTDFGADCMVFDLSDYVGQPNVRIRFQNINDNGNNFYIDNVRLTADCQTVAPPVAAMSATPRIGCAPLEVQYQDETNGTVTSRQWNFPGGSPAFSTEINPVVTYSQPGSFSATLTVTNAAGTDLVAEADYITVLGPPTVNFTSAVQGFIATFTNQTVNGNSFLWNFGDGGTSTQQNPSHTYTDPGTYTVRLTATNECGSRFLQHTVTIVNPLTAGFTAGPSSGCAPLTVTFNDTTTGGATSWSWTFDGGDPATSTSQNPVVTFPLPGTYIVSLTASSGGATSTFQDTIVVNGPPQSGFTADNPLGNTTVSFDNTSMDAESYHWDFGDGSTSTDNAPTHTYGADGDYTVMLIATNACGSDTSQQTVTILTPPTNAGFSGSASEGCAPLEVTFSATPQGPGFSYAWTFEGGTPTTSTDANPSVMYAFPGNYEVVLIVSNAAGSDTATTTNAVSVTGGPTSGFTANNPLGAVTVSFGNSSVNATGYSWDFGDNSTSTDNAPTHTYGADGEYSVTLIATNACGSDTSQQTVTILTPPSNAGFSSSTSQGCAPLEVTYSATPQGPGLTYAWTFEGGTPTSSTDANPSVMYAFPGNYEVVMIVSNAAGSDTATITNAVTVTGGPTAGFSANNPLGSVTVSFGNSSVNATGYSWDFGDGETGTEASPAHNYEADGDYTVTLIASNACGNDTTQQVVTILMPPVAGISSGTTTGCAGLEVAFSASPQGDGLTYEWVFEGGSPSVSTDANPVVTYATPGVYGSVLIVTNAAGSDTMEQADYVLVTGGPTASFTNSVNGYDVFFTNTSINSTSSSWDFGDGQSSSDPSPQHNFAEPGTYLVTLTVENDCGQSVFSETIVIDEDLPISDFDANANEGCAPLTIQFTSQAINADSLWWEFPGGNPGSSSDSNPLVEYDMPGAYNVTLIAFNTAGSASLTRSSWVVIQPAPEAAFESAIDEVTVQFTNNSAHTATYFWTFGDGSTSDEQSPTHNYPGAGSFTVQLIATGVCGSDTIEQTIVIEGQAPAPDFTTDVNGGCAPVTIQFTDESDGNPTAWSWSFPGGTPATSTEQNPVVTYENAGIYGVELTVSNAFGAENLSVAPVVFVDDLPQAAFTYQTSLLQVDFVVTGAQVGVSYHWEFGDGATGDGLDVGHEYSGPGSYTVKLIAANDCGESTTTQEVQLIIDATTDQDKPANQLHLYPNPNDGQFTLKGELYGEQVALLTIFNAIGQKIDQRIKPVVQNRLEERYHFEQLPAGVYYLVVEVNAKTYYLKFVTV